MAGSTQAQELQERGRKFSQIIEDHEDGYYEIDLNGNFIYFNRAILLMSGYSSSKKVSREPKPHPIFSIFSSPLIWARCAIS